MVLENWKIHEPIKCCIFSAGDLMLVKYVGENCTLVKNRYVGEELCMLVKFHQHSYPWNGWMLVKVCWWKVMLAKKISMFSPTYPKFFTNILFFTNIFHQHHYTRLKHMKFLQKWIKFSLNAVSANSILMCENRVSKEYKVVYL